MAAAVHSDMVIFNDQFYGGFLEKIADRLDVFNAASNNALSLNTSLIKGFKQEESYFKRTASKSSRRDLTSNAALTDAAIVQGQINTIKVFRKWHDANTMGAYRTLGLGPSEMAFVAGSAAADDILEDWRLGAISALMGGMSIAGVVSTNLHDATDGTLASSDLIEAKKKLGDAGGKIKIWVMHSTVYYNLVANQLASTTADQVADMAIMAGTPATMGIPVLVVDDPGLIIADGVSAGVDSYYTFGLVEGAVKVVESEEQEVLMEQVSGAEQLLFRVQAEYAFNVGLRGISWTSATTNPTFAQLGTNSNWTKLYTSHKDLPGVVIESRGV